MEAEKESIDPVLKWQNSYVDALIDKLQPKGTILQVGYGNGYAAKQIQKCNPTQHTIIEYNSDQIEQAKLWSKDFPNVTILETTWEEAKDKLGEFDTIFYNDYPVFNEREVIKRQTPEQANKSADEAKELLASLEEQFASCDVSFTDSEIDEFYEKIGKNHSSSDLEIFFQNLMEHGFITKDQHKKALEKHCKTNLSPEKTAAQKNEKSQLLEFIEDCIEKHSHKGTCISFYVDDDVSKYEDQGFFKYLITNPQLNYEEDMLTIEVPDCHYKFAVVTKIEIL